MKAIVLILTFTTLAPAQPIAAAKSEGNLLRNADFQDDWLTVLPETKNHHWCYSSEFYHRRDFNPDGWNCKGSWRWLNAEQPMGQRRMVLQGPGASLMQRVNWVLVFDSRTMGNMADAGGFPAIKEQRSLQPTRVVRDLTFRVRLKGQDVPAKAGSIELGLSPPGAITISDPFGSQTQPNVQVSLPLPEGTFVAKTIEVKLLAEQWLKSIQDAAFKNPKEAPVFAKSGPILPGTVRVAVAYQAKQGSIELESAELVEAGPAPPNLLAHGGFEEPAKEASSMPVGWSGPSKYRYFPGRLYYIFNTWHNGAFDNRGKVQLDSLVVRSGKHSLQMIVPSGDEMAMSSSPIVLKQTEAKLLEVTAFVKTDCLAALNIDAVDEKGDRLDAFTFITMAPNSIGTNDWRQIRQVFRPRRPVESIRLMLCARGVNGYTLDDTGHQPQNNVVGTIWWDDVKLYEPESTKEELTARQVVMPKEIENKAGPRVDNLDLGERMLGDNVLTATLVNSDPAPRNLGLRWDFISPTGKKSSFAMAPVNVAGQSHLAVKLPYVLSELCPDAYTEYHSTLTLVHKDQAVGSTELWFGTWTVPIDLELGALYLRPNQKQFVRMNLGLSAPAIKTLAKVRLDVIRRGTGQVVRSQDVSATAAIIEEQRQKIPAKLRDDFTNLLLTDLNVAFLPLQSFADPQRNFFVRATAVARDGKALGSTDSPPFCRMDHEPPQPPVKSVTVKKNLLYVNDKPWMPWGVIYGHCAVYDGPADPGKYIDLHNLPGWNMYDGFVSSTYTRSENDFNCNRYVAASITPNKTLEKNWAEQNLYASTVYVVPSPVFSLAELEKGAGGKDNLQAYLTYAKTAPMVVSTAPGIEEAFGLFHEKSPAQLKGLEQVVEFLRKETGKPVMVGHGGYWNRLEFEKVPFFDIFDPETEPLYPANLHTDLLPLVRGKDKAIWIRPQMYEDVPYERWRFHVYVELMRGCRGWQIAHGPGDASLFRGLHAEMEYMKSIAYSQDPGPRIEIQPDMEHFSRKHNGKTYLIAATTRGMTLGHWRWANKPNEPQIGLRMTGKPHLHLSDANSYGADQKVDQGPSIYGIQYLPLARTWPAGSKLVQQVRLDDKTRPENLVALVKADGRWIHAASWGKFAPADWSKDPERALWFLRSFYRHAYGFLGWGDTLLEQGKQYMPQATLAMGDLPKSGMVALEVPLDKIGITPNMLIDGVGFAHQGGRVDWGETALVDAAGQKTVIWGEALEPPADVLAKTKITVPGLAKGSKIRVLFEDRQIVAEDGYFIDDFRGQDLYQRFGGGYGVGYGDGKVALHVYEIP